MFTRPGVEPTTANRSEWRKSSRAVSDSNVYTPPKMPSARSASHTFEASPGTAAKAGANSSHELANSSSESPSRLKFTIRICTATSLVRARGPQEDDDVPARCTDEDLMRIGLPRSGLVLVDSSNGPSSLNQQGVTAGCAIGDVRCELVKRHRPSSGTR